jgi:raffinose/stachyose/melibiose transport system substrate-binding protein
MNKKSGVRIIAAAAASILVSAGLIGVNGVAANAASSNNTIVFHVPTVLPAGTPSPWEAVVNAFEKANPQYTVTIKYLGATGSYQTELATELVAGNGPDVFKVSPGQGQGDSIINLAKAGFLADLSKTKAATANPKGSLSVMGIGGKTYGLGTGVTPGVVVANFSLLQKDGLTWPTTFGDLLTDCKTAVSKGKTFFGLAGGMVPNDQLLVESLLQTTYKDTTWAAKRLAGKVTFAKDAGYKQALQQIISMKSAGCFQAGAEAGGFADAIDQNFFGSKVYAVFVPGSTAIPFGKFVPPLQGQTIQAAYIPAVKAADTRVPASINVGIAVNSKTKASAAAKAFVNFFASDAGQAAYQAITGDAPMNKPDSRTEFAPIAGLLSAGKTFEVPLNTFTSNAVSDALGKGVQGLLTGQATVAQILQSMDAAWGN